MQKVRTDDIDEAIALLKRNEDENCFILSYLSKLERKQYTLCLDKGTFILYVRGLLAAISYSDEPSDAILSFLEREKPRITIAPGLALRTMLSGIDAESIRCESLMVYERKNGLEKSHSEILSTEDEYASLIEFYEKIDEFASYYTYHDMARKYTIQDSAHFASVIRKNGCIISSLFVNDGLIASVGTLKEERKKGYATRNIKGAMNYYFENNPHSSKIYLLYSDQNVRSLYSAIGFTDICPYTVVKRSIKQDAACFK